MCVWERRSLTNLLKIESIIYYLKFERFCLVFVVTVEKILEIVQILAFIMSKKLLKIKLRAKFNYKPCSTCYLEMKEKRL